MAESIKKADGSLLSGTGVEVMLENDGGHLKRGKRIRFHVDHTKAMAPGYQLL